MPPPPVKVQRPVPAPAATRPVDPFQLPTKPDEPMFLNGMSQETKDRMTAAFGAPKTTLDRNKDRAEAIRATRLRTGASYAMLARDFGVSEKTIANIVTGKTHADGGEE